VKALNNLTSPILSYNSLIATFLRNRILGAMRSSEAPVQLAAQLIDQNVVFSNPTIDSLANHIATLVSSPKSVPVDKIEEAVANMESLVKQYTVTLPSSPREIKETVLLTGSTGALGSQLLAQMLVDERVECVWAVNRRSPSGTILERQRESFADKGLDVDLSEQIARGKLVFIEADLSQERLGLDKRLYREVRLIIRMHVSPTIEPQSPSPKTDFDVHDLDHP